MYLIPDYYSASLKQGIFWKHGGKARSAGHAGAQGAAGTHLEADGLWGSVLPGSALPEVTAPLPQPGAGPPFPGRDSWNNVTFSHPIPTEPPAFSVRDGGTQALGLGGGHR